jgi:hypothetical protein
MNPPFLRFLNRARSDLVLELGGFAAEKESLFYGKIAELIIFTRALATHETSSIVRYLRESHQL